MYITRRMCVFINHIGIIKASPNSEHPIKVVFDIREDTNDPYGHGIIIEQSDDLSAEFDSWGEAEAYADAVDELFSRDAEFDWDEIVNAAHRLLSEEV